MHLSMAMDITDDIFRDILYIKIPRILDQCSHKEKHMNYRNVASELESFKTPLYPKATKKIL